MGRPRSVVCSTKSLKPSYGRYSYCIQGSSPYVHVSNKRARAPAAHSPARPQWLPESPCSCFFLGHGSLAAGMVDVGKPRCPVPGSADASNAALLRHWVGTCMYLTVAAGETGRAGLCGPYSGSFVSPKSRGCAYYRRRRCCFVCMSGTRAAAEM